MPYPEAGGEIEQIVHDHYATLDEDGLPLVLAVYYHSAIAPDDECLFEVAQNFGSNEVSGIGEMTQVEFGPTQRYPLGGRSLRLTLTSPNECQIALQQRWPEVQDVVDAARRQQATIVFHREGVADPLTGALGLASAA